MNIKAIVPHLIDLPPSPLPPEYRMATPRELYSYPMTTVTQQANFASLASKISHDIETTQKPSRLLHIFGVVQSSLALATLHGVDHEKVTLAALLHDCAKHIGRDETLQLVSAGAITLQPDDMDCPAMWHGPVAAWIARDTYGITDPEILDAVENHTLGQPNPSKLLQILICADTTEPGRVFPGVEELRKNVRNDLRTGVVAVLKAKLCDVEARAKKPHPRMFQTLQSLEN